mmetsp:Transcript_75074/g.244090  ORF Transcript_75074/g.244090 Transcript_75074/m.244090 type:complete len:406 (+) Transcript_75074:1-1218(+)
MGLVPADMASRRKHAPKHASRLSHEGSTDKIHISSKWRGRSIISLLVFALLCNGSALHKPSLVAHLVDELLGVGNDDDAALVTSKTFHQGVEGLHVDVIRRLVQRDNVGLGPEGRTKGQLRLLTSREASNLSVQDHLLIQAELLKVLDDLFLRQWPLVDAGGRCRLALIEGLRIGRDTQFFQLLHGQDGVLLLVRQSLPLDLVQDLVRTDHAANDVGDLVTILAELDRKLLAHGGLHLVGRLEQSSLQGLIVSVLVALLDVDIRTAIHELCQVEHVLLRDVGQAQVPVLDQLARGLAARAGRRDELAAEEIQQRTLSGAVDTDNADPACQSDLATHVVQDHRALNLVVREEYVLQLHDRLRRRVALQCPRDREADLGRFVEHARGDPAAGLPALRLLADGQRVLR